MIFVLRTALVQSMFAILIGSVLSGNLREGGRRRRDQGQRRGAAQKHFRIDASTVVGPSFALC